MLLTHNPESECLKTHWGYANPGRSDSLFWWPEWTVMWQHSSKEKNVNGMELSHASSRKLLDLEGGALGNTASSLGCSLNGSGVMGLCFPRCFPRSVFNENKKVSVSVHWGLWVYDSTRLGLKCSNSCSFCPGLLREARMSWHKVSSNR